MIGEWKYILIALWISLVAIPSGFCQEFNIEGGRKSFKLPFDQVNSLVIIPVELNGVNLSFLLDTGVDSTVLFSIPDNDSMVVRNASQIWIKGLGMEEPVEGYKSQGNTIKIGKASNKDFTFYTVYEEHTDLSQRMGIPIHGIIGNDFFKDFVVEIRYTRSILKVYETSQHSFRKCRKCEEFKLQFHRNKPYITLKGKLNGVSLQLNLLIDSGSGDALWLFENDKKNITVPAESFPDYLGYGFGGSIYGSRSRIEELNFGKLQLEEITAGFPDTTFTYTMQEFIHRDGTLGAKVLNRFRVVLDYKGERIQLKPNRKFKESFEYDMSGVALAKTNQKLVKEHTLKKAENKVWDTTYSEYHLQTNYNFRPEYEIVEIRPNSPADKSGLEIGDILKNINGKPAHSFTMEQILNLFSSPEGKRIKLKIEREGEEYATDFLLKRVL